MDGLSKSLVVFGNAGMYRVGKDFPPDACTNFVAKAKKNTVRLTWTDPENSIAGESYPVFWDKSVVVRKKDSVPVDVNDGVMVVTNDIRNQYQNEPFLDSGLEYNVTYYYRVFSCSRYGVYNTETEVSVSVTPKPTRVMTVKIDLSNSNPATCGSYADDAVTMTEGKTSQDWYEFFGYKPCLFKDGQVVGYLNPDDYSKFEDGTDADITSGNAGDVMVEFPRRGLKISKTNKIITVSMTDDPNDPAFKYYAHQRGDVQKDYFYVGAYLGYGASDKLRSLSGKAPTTSVSLSAHRTHAANLGSGYMNVGFYQFLFLQCMYLLQYKGNLDSQTAHGYGYCNSGSRSNTGTTDTKGMMYGTSSGHNESDHVKLFGIEDFWGNFNWILDGYYVDNSYNIMTTTDGFDDTSGYISRGTPAGTSNNSGYFNDVTGTTETGFTPKTFNGSTTTYFCDSGKFYPSYAPCVGGLYNRGYEPGIFFFEIYWGQTETNSSVGARLGYL